MKITCIMMQKNEAVLLEPWILYHGLLFGLDNLYIYDNGSTDPISLSILDRYELLGLNVVREFSKKLDFENKGYLFSEKIKKLDATDPSDFYFPMDCDEFVVAENREGEVVVNKSDVIESLAPYLESSAPLAIAAGFDNNPAKEGYFYRAKGQRKTFFSKGTCWTLDLGFHDGQTRSKETAVRTQIAYIHFHYKDFNQYVLSAKQKLEGRIDSFSRKSLEIYSEEKKAGFHLVGTLLGGRDKYYLNHYNRYKKLSKSFYKLCDFNSVMASLKMQYETLNPNLFNAFDKDIPRWKGYIDSIELFKNQVSLKGWIVSLYDLDFSNIVLLVSGKKYLVNEYKRSPRLDVTKKVEFSGGDPGIELIFNTSFDAKYFNSEEVSIYLEDQGARFDFSFSGKVVDNTL